MTQRHAENAVYAVLIAFLLYQFVINIGAIFTNVPFLIALAAGLAIWGLGWLGLWRRMGWMS
ncbi:MAG: hypothetical protein WAT78_03895 [Rhizobiaceae bacterium]